MATKATSPIHNHLVRSRIVVISPVNPRHFRPLPHIYVTCYTKTESNY